MQVKERTWKDTTILLCRVSFVCLMSIKPGGHCGQRCMKSQGNICVCLGYLNIMSHQPAQWKQRWGAPSIHHDTKKYLMMCKIVIHHSQSRMYQRQLNMAIIHIHCNPHTIICQTFPFHPSMPSCCWLYTNARNSIIIWQRNEISEAPQEYRAILRKQEWQIF